MTSEPSSSAFLPRLAAVLADRYRIERELGTGGMATVYLATELKHDRRVAIKALDAELPHSAAEDRFLREIKYLSQLQHPFIVGLIDSGIADGRPFYVMPYIEGESLRTRIERKGPLAIADALRIAREAADALNYAHARGIIHRDVKPGNILLGSDHARVADFGIARALDPGTSEQVTSQGMAIGTVAYMSPEQMSAESRIDGRSDIYSLGCVLYEMITGEPPFAGSEATIRARRFAGVYDSPRMLRSTVPAELDQLIGRCLAVNPADRVPSAADLGHALLQVELAVASSSLAAAGVSDQRVASAGGGLRRWWIGAILAAAALLAGGLVANRWSGGSTIASSDSDTVRVAILRFGAEGNPRAEGWARSIARTLLDSLSAVRSLRIAALPLADSLPVVDSLSRGGGFSLIIAGAVSAVDDGCEATIRVLLARDRTQLVRYSALDAPAQCTMGANDLANSITRYVRRFVGSQVREARIGRGTNSVAAREAWERATALLRSAESGNARVLTLETIATLDVADSLFREASRDDPRWSAPRVSRAWSLLARAEVEASEAQRAPARVEAIAMAQALSDSILRDYPGEASAYELRGATLLQAWFEASPATADRLSRETEAALRQAVALDPEAARAWDRLSAFYLYTGKFAEALSASQRALVADAFLISEPTILVRQASIELELQHAAAARKICQDGARSYSDDYRFKVCELTVLGSSASGDAAVARIRALGAEAEAQIGGNRRTDVRRQTLLWTATAMARGGQYQGARELHREFRTLAGEDLDGFLANEAYLLLLLGERGEAVARIRRFVELNPQMRGYVRQTPMYSTLHHDADFEAIVGPS